MKPPPITPDSIDRALRYRFGEHNAITLANLASLLGCSRRIAEQAIELHLSDLPYTVISSSRGLFRPVAAEEIEHYLASMRSRIKCIATRMRTVRKAAAADGFPMEHGRFTSAPMQAQLFP